MLRILGRKNEPWMLHIVLELYLCSGCGTFAYHRDNLHFIHGGMDGEILQQSSHSDASRARREIVFWNLAEVDTIC
jgi:hypothetical protein